MAPRNRSICLWKCKQAPCRKQMWSDHQKSCWLHNGKGKQIIHQILLFIPKNNLILKSCNEVYLLKTLFLNLNKGICRPIGHSIFGDFGQKRNKCRASIHDHGRWNKKSCRTPGPIWTWSSWWKSKHRINACSKTRRIRMLLILIT